MGSKQKSAEDYYHYLQQVNEGGAGQVCIPAPGGMGRDQEAELTIWGRRDVLTFLT